jgi:hypothetical protein
MVLLAEATGKCKKKAVTTLTLLPPGDNPIAVNKYYYYYYYYVIYKEVQPLGRRCPTHNLVDHVFKSKITQQASGNGKT